MALVERYFHLRGCTFAGAALRHDEFANAPRSGSLPALERVLLILRLNRSKFLMYFGWCWV